MNKKDLTDRIETIDRLKDIEDILDEISLHTFYCWYSLVIPTLKLREHICLYVRVLQGDFGPEVAKFEITEQNPKIRALKDALLWILNHSGLKKER